MSNDNYQNFIYLFNDENNVSLVSLINSKERTSVYSFASYAKLGGSRSYFQQLADQGRNDIQVFLNDSTLDDFPIESISSQRLKQKNICTSAVSSIESTNILASYYIESNDPGLDPNFLNFFKLDNVETAPVETSFDSKKINIPKQGSTPHYRFAIGDKIKAVYGAKYQDYIELIDLENILEGADNLEKKENFTYRHYKKVKLKDLNSDRETYGHSNLPNLVQTFFTSLYGVGANNSSELGNKNLNIACKIGVPYDFQTVINDKVNEKSLGISIKQPSYEKIYNYYDPQYEPLAIKLINTFLVDEKTLPSIYDFIFLENQKNELRPIIGLPGLGVDPERVNIANINQYLDKFAKVYAEFIKRGGKKRTLEDLHAQLMYPSIAPAAQFMLDPNESVAKYSENSPVNQLPSKIPKLQKSCAAKTLKSVILDYLPIVNDKKEKIPKWIDSLKTGIYFKENSLNLFNDTLDKDDAFPFLIKVNLPVEKKGPISNLMSEYGFLDSINSYAASINIPTDETNQEGEFFVSGYDTFCGGVLNGYNNVNCNLFSNVQFPSFKIFLRNAPKPEIASAPLATPNPAGSSLDTQVSPDSFGSPKGSLTGESPILPIASQNNEEDTLADVLESLTITNPIESPTDIYLNTFEAIGDNALNNVFVYNADEKSTLPTHFAALLGKLKLEKFKEKLTSLLLEKKLFRTPSQIHKGQMAHQETIMYEITKYKINALGDQEYVQSIFLPICNQGNLSYYDTQVIPYQDYFYKIYAYKIIVGTEYGITPFSETEMVEYKYTSGAITMAYDVEPFLQVVRVPYYNARHVNIKEDKLNHSRVEDAPPLAPQVDFVPFRNIDNKIMMLFNNSIGEVLQYPKIILPDDKKIFENVYLAQDRKPGSELLFKSDDSLGTFQIFRTDNLPKYYRNVNEDDSLKFVQIEQPTDINKSMNTSFVDNILPNKHYYYFFRFLDIHGKVSNPSIVYKVMMKKEKNMTPYLQIDTVDLAEIRQKEYDDRFTSTKSLQKYLLVDLASSQKEPNYNNVEVDDTFDFRDPDYLGSYSSVQVSFDNSGNTTQSAFGKRFKFRLTSKQTGKKIDINLKVKQPEVKLNN